MIKVIQEKKMLNTIKARLSAIDKRDDIEDKTAEKEAALWQYLDSNPYGYSGADYVDIVDEISNELGYGDNFMDDYRSKKNRDFH